ncbi:MAG: hypothetical protein ACYDBJ_29400 [Aggregatilineales bacterium]
MRALKDEHVDYADYADFPDAMRQIAHWLDVEYNSPLSLSERLVPPPLFQFDPNSCPTFQLHSIRHTEHSVRV